MWHTLQCGIMNSLINWLDRTESFFRACHSVGNIFAGFYGIVFVTIRHWLPFWARWIHYTPLHTIYLRTILIFALPPMPRSSRRSLIFSFWLKYCALFLSDPCLTKAPFISSSFIWCLLQLDLAKERTKCVHVSSPDFRKISFYKGSCLILSKRLAEAKHLRIVVVVQYCIH
jgi:hypothetical protein